MEAWVSGRVLLRLGLTALASVCLVLVPASTTLASNNGDVWVDNVGQPPGPGQEQDPHLACQDINLWGNDLAGSSGSYTIDGWDPSGNEEQDYASTWSYDQSAGGDQVLDVISVKKLLDAAIANGDGPQVNQGFHFKLQFSLDPQKHKTFWVDCAVPSTTSQATPSIVTHATSGTAGQPIYDVATLTGGHDPSGTITWNIYAAGACTTSLGTVTDLVNGDGTYNSPTLVPNAIGTYQWVAKYSGDSNDTSVSTLCNDPNEQSTVQPAPAPGISLIKLERNGSSGSFTRGPVKGNVGDTIDYQMTVIDTGNTSLVITFTDLHCDAGTLSAPAVVRGTFDQATSTLSAGGELQYTCSHVLGAGDAPQFPNTASVTGQPPHESPVSATDTVLAQLNTPGMTVTKLQRDWPSGSFTTGTITATVGDTIQYEIRVANIGNTTLTLSLNDPHCDTGTLRGPNELSGTLNGSVLSPGGRAKYTCSHVLRAGDASPFTNTATVTGQPPSGPPVSGVSSVTTKKQAVKPKKIVRCPKGKVKRTRKVHGSKKIACVAKKRPVIARRPIRASGFTG